MVTLAAVAGEKPLDLPVVSCETKERSSFIGVQIMLSREDVLEQVLALPPADQAYVADCVEQQLSADGIVSPDVAEAWSQEIDRRIAAYDRGETTAVDFDVAVNHLRQAIAEHRIGRNPQ